ncbi:MAG: hypothetical protein ACYTKC_06570 [Planctomycetota bacterium]|jgi:hypothetical protein
MRKTSSALLLAVLLSGCSQRSLATETGVLAGDHAANPQASNTPARPSPRYAELGGSTRWILKVGSAYDPSVLRSVGAVHEWYWPETGIAVASTTSQTFPDDIRAGRLPAVFGAMPDVVIREQTALSLQKHVPTSGPRTVSHGLYIGSPDAFDVNVQWPLLALGMARLKTRPGGARVETIKDAKGHIFDNYLPPYQSKMTVNDEGSGVTMAFIEYGAIPWCSSRPLNGYRRFRLHPDMSWYKGDIVDPVTKDVLEIDKDGGIVPVFVSIQLYTTYYNSLVNNGDPFSELERLPNPASVNWEEPDPVNTPGYLKGYVQRKVEATTRMQVVIDPILGGRFVMVAHVTGVVGICAMRHDKPLPREYDWGRGRGVAPRAKIVGYGHHDSSLSNRLLTFYRATRDKVQTVNTSGMSMGVVQWTPGTGDPYQDPLYQAWLASTTALHESGALLIPILATDRWPNDGWARVEALLPDRLKITWAGTAPRDYDPYLDELTKYLPTPGVQRPFDLEGRAYNLDRMTLTKIYSSPAFFYQKQAPVEVVTPQGGHMGPHFYATDPESRAHLPNMAYGASPYENSVLYQHERPDLNIGYHGWALGASIAGPYINGAAALAAGAYKKAHGVLPRPDVLKEIMLKSADDLVGPKTDEYYYRSCQTCPDVFHPNEPMDQPGVDPWYGHGRINVHEAIRLAKSWPHR